MLKIVKQIYVDRMEVSGHFYTIIIVLDFILGFIWRA